VPSVVTVTEPAREIPVRPAAARRPRSPHAVALKEPPRTVRKFNRFAILEWPVTRLRNIT